MLDVPSNPLYLLDYNRLTRSEKLKQHLRQGAATQADRSMMNVSTASFSSEIADDLSYSVPITTNLGGTPDVAMQLSDDSNITFELHQNSTAMTPELAKH